MEEEESPASNVGERKERIQEVIDRSIPAYERSEEFITDLEELFKKYPLEKKE